MKNTIVIHLKTINLHENYLLNTHTTPWYTPFIKVEIFYIMVVWCCIVHSIHGTSASSYRVLLAANININPRTQWEARDLFLRLDQPFLNTVPTFALLFDINSVIIEVIYRVCVCMCVCVGRYGYYQTYYQACYGRRLLEEILNNNIWLHKKYTWEGWGKKHSDLYILYLDWCIRPLTSKFTAF